MIGAVVPRMPERIYTSYYCTLLMVSWAGNRGMMGGCVEIRLRDGDVLGGNAAWCVFCLYLFRKPRDLV